MTSTHSIQDMKNIADPESQIAALKRLKNEAVGHIHKKEALVKAGLLTSLATVLESWLQGRQGKTSTTDQVAFHALTVLSSIASGDASLIAPIIAAGLPSIIVTTIAPAHFPDKIVSASLKTLVALHKTDRQSSLGEPRYTSLVNLCLTHEAVQTYVAILQNKSQSPSAKQHTSLVCQLLEQLIRTDEQRLFLQPYALVECLATHLTSYYAHNHPRSSQAFNAVIGPLPAPPSNATLSHIMGAIDLLIQNSRYRVASLLLCPIIMRVLPFYQSQHRYPPKIAQASQQSVYDVSPRDLSLPMIQLRIEKSDTTSFLTSFPALGAHRTPGDGSKAGGFDFADIAPTPDSRTRASLYGQGTAFVPWLVSIMRSASSICRVKAASLLATIADAEFLSTNKERMLSLLVVPLLADILKNAQYSQGSLAGASTRNPFNDPDLCALAEAPRALASLLEKMPLSLTKCASDLGILRDACQILKHTFGAVDAYPPLWSVNPDSVKMEEELIPSSATGDKGVPPSIVWIYRCRESALLLVAAFASRDDTYKSKLTESDVTKHLIDSMTPLRDEALAQLHSRICSAGKDKLDAAIGNPDGILMAACRAISYLSRSVTLLRTSLLDAELAKPVFALVKHSNVDVSHDAIRIICNLVMEFSPMRSDLVEDGVIPVLGNLAQGSDRRIRSVSLWAMKNLVSLAPNDVKIQCLAALDPNWLAGIMDGEALRVVTPHAQPLSEITNAKGERIELLHPIKDEQMSDDPSRVGTSFATERSAQTLDSGHGSLTPDERSDFLADINREEERATATQRERDVIRIQENAMGFLRNLTTTLGKDKEMIDHLRSQLGLDRLLDLIASKLKPLQASSALAPGDAVGEDELKRRYHPTRIITGAIYLLSHLAASDAHTRTLIVQQPALLLLVRPFFNYPDLEARIGCLWICINLMWADDGADGEAARRRAQELARHGFRDDIVARRDDSSLDVRERANTAFELIEGRHAREGAGARR